MDDKRLAEQLAKTGKLMDLTYDDDWWADVEHDDGRVEAGEMAKPYVAYLDSLTPEQHRSLRQQMRLFSILYPELKTWIQSWELGRSFDAVYLQARKCICKRLQKPTPEQTDWITTLIAEDDQNRPRSERPLRAQVIPMLSALLTQEDRQALADIAAQGMAQGVLQMVQVESASPIAV
ncbi:MAG: hypothetical protein F6K31_17140 [Symploca sp. SIO2G7]|nr:hypothetical protein [Symploca sp. SIO2G7]